jgi:hypothetical protein
MTIFDADTSIALPSEWVIEEVNQHGSSSWSTGYKLCLEKDGEEKEYFLKVCDLRCSHTRRELLITDRLAIGPNTRRWPLANTRVRKH